MDFLPYGLGVAVQRLPQCIASVRRVNCRLNVLKNGQRVNVRCPNFAIAPKCRSRVYFGPTEGSYLFGAPKAMRDLG